MVIKKRNQQNELDFSDGFTLQNLCKFYYFMCLQNSQDALQFPLSIHKFKILKQFCDFL